MKSGLFCGLQPDVNAPPNRVVGMKKPILLLHKDGLYEALNQGSNRRGNG